MNNGAARVVLVVPASWDWYFEPERKCSIAWYAERALGVADKLSPGRGLEVFLYGESKSGNGTEVIQTKLERAGLRKWIEDWGVRPNLKRGLFQDSAPGNQVEQRLGVGESPWHGLPLPAVQAVAESCVSYDGATLVLFWLDRMTQAEEMVRFIAGHGDPHIFWHFFGDPEDVYYSFWTKDGMHKGKVIPNIHFHLGLNWSRTGILRVFSRWISAN